MFLFTQIILLYLQKSIKTASPTASFTTSMCVRTCIESCTTSTAPKHARYRGGPKETLPPSFRSIFFRSFSWLVSNGSNQFVNNQKSSNTPEPRRGERSFAPPCTWNMDGSSQKTTGRGKYLRQSNTNMN